MFFFFKTTKGIQHPSPRLFNSYNPVTLEGQDVFKKLAPKLNFGFPTKAKDVC